MDKKERLLERLTIAADLPDECIPGLPLVELYGNTRVLVEHHRGISEYTAEQICLNVKFGQIRIYGSKLVIARMTREQLVITGLIEGVSICRRVKG